MSLVNGELSEHGAVIDVFVGVSHSHRAALKRGGLAPPKAVAVRARLDTGSFITGFTTALFAQLGLRPIRVIQIRTPSTSPDRPCDAPVFDVVLTLVSGTNPITLSVQAIASDDFDRDGDVHGIIGRDSLDRCNLTWLGPDRRFSLAY